MARIAKLKGTFLTPGVSKNGRKYTAENIGKAVGRMQARIAAGTPIPMHTSHEANARGDTRATAAHITAVHQAADGSGHFEADVLDTAAGKDIRTLTVPGSDGKRALKTVSIFGRWMTPVEKDENGNVTSSDLDVPAVDFTHSPGVEGAQIEDAQLAEMALAGLFGESATVEEVFAEGASDIEFIEESGEPVPSALALLEAESTHIFGNGICESCLNEAKAETPGSNYADPGYQADKVKRYPLDTAKHARAAWSYINMPKNAGKYSPAQLKRIKSKITGAAKKFGIDISKESEALAGLLESMGGEIADVLEAYASTSLDNGQGTINVSAYTEEPADLPKVGMAVARAALAGLLNLDPDNDGDVDLPGGDAPPGDDDKECESCGASDVPSTAMFCPQCGQPVPGAEAQANTERSSVMEFTLEQVKALPLTAERLAALDESKTSYTSEEVAELMKPEAPTETAPTITPEAAAAVAALLGIKPTAPTEEDELTKARRLVAEADAAKANQPATAAEIAELVKAGITEATKGIREEAIEAVRRGGAAGRKGLVEQAGAVKSGEFERDPKKLSEQSTEDFRDTLATSLGELLPA